MSRPAKKGDAKTDRQQSAGFAARLAGWLIVAGLVGAIALVPSATFFGGHSPFGPPKALTLAISALLVAAGLALSGQAAGRAFGVTRESRTAQAGLLLLAWTALATALGPYGVQSWVGNYPDYRGFWMLVAAALAAAAVATFDNSAAAVRLLSRTLSAAVLFVALFALTQLAGVLPSESSSDFRLSGPLGNASNLGVYLALALPLVVFGALRDPRPSWRFVGYAASGCGAVMVVASQSRGAWLGVMLSLAIAAVSWWQLSGRSRRVFVLAGSALLAVALVVGVAVGVRTVLTEASAHKANRGIGAGGGTTTWRATAWRSTGEMVLDHPAVGVGVNGFRLAYTRYLQPGQITGLFGYQVIESAHNLELDTAASTGLPGLVVLVAMLGFVTAASIRAIRAGDEGAVAVAAGLAGGLGALQFHYATMDTAPLLVALLGAVALREAAPRRSEAGEIPAAVWGLRGASAAVAIGLAAAVFAFASLQVADVYLASGRAAAAKGGDWRRAASEFDHAHSLAPWEPAVETLRATAAGGAYEKSSDPTALKDGLAAADSAIEGLHGAPYARYLKGQLLLSRAVADNDPGAAEQALAVYEDALAVEKGNGVLLAGKGAAQLALRQDAEALATLKDAMVMSPRYRRGWLLLAEAYRRAGLQRRAELAEFRARK